LSPSQVPGPLAAYAANKDRKNLVATWNWGIKYLDPPLPGPNPCLVERMPEVRHPRYVPPEEDFWKIYAAAEGQDKVMLLTFLHLAARRGEVFRLTWQDVDFGNDRIRLGTRKRKDGSFEWDWLPMTQELRKALRWLWEHRPIKDSPYVFVCLDEKECQKEHYGNRFLYRHQFMRALCETAKVKPFGFHAIRHLTASTLYKLGYEVAAIQSILRHKSPGTTERYLKSIGMERVREALESLSPRVEDAEVIAFDKMIGTGDTGAGK
jgi:integrase